MSRTKTPAAAGRQRLPQGALLLCAWRARLGLNQFQASQLVGLDPATYNKIERGHLSPGMKRAARIATATGEGVPIAAWAPERRAA